jgi:nicotinamidase-related amidase
MMMPRLLRVKPCSSHGDPCRPGTGLETLLQEYGVRKVWYSAWRTRLVVEAAVFELTDRGYETFVVEDCCASGRADLHAQSIEILRAFATIVSSTETAGYSVLIGLMKDVRETARSIAGIIA